MKLLASDEFTRAFYGGTGAYKVLSSQCPKASRLSCVVRLAAPVGLHTESLELQIRHASRCKKVGANYGTGIMPFTECAKQGFSQILWLLPEGDDFLITEVLVAHVTSLPIILHSFNSSELN